MKPLLTTVLLLPLLFTTNTFGRPDPATRPARPALDGAQVQRVRNAWKIYDELSRTTQDQMAALVKKELPDFVAAADAARDAQKTDRERATARLDYLLLHDSGRLDLTRGVAQLGDIVLNDWTPADEQKFIASSKAYADILKRRDAATAARAAHPLPDATVMQEKIFKSEAFAAMMGDVKAAIANADAALAGKPPVTTGGGEVASQCPGLPDDYTPEKGDVKPSHRTTIFGLLWATPSILFAALWIVSSIITPPAYRYAPAGWSIAVRKGFLDVQRTGDPSSVSPVIVNALPPYITRATSFTGTGEGETKYVAGYFVVRMIMQFGGGQSTTAHIYSFSLPGLLLLTLPTAFLSYRCFRQSRKSVATKVKNVASPAATTCARRPTAARNAARSSPLI